MAIATTEEVMADFILSSGKNLHTALLAYKAFPVVAEKLVCDFAKRIESALSEEPGWKVTRNDLASSPRERWGELKWAPVEWEDFGWGICLSPQKFDAAEMIFGIFGVTATSRNPDYLGNIKTYPAMPDEDRTRLGNALGPLLDIVGDRGRSSEWWPRYTVLREIRNWMEPSTLTKLAAANKISDERDLVSGKLMDAYVLDLFYAAKKAIADLPGLRDIRPVPA